MTRPAWNRSPTPHYAACSLRFRRGVARAVVAPPDADPARVVAALGLAPGRPALYLSGGAGGMAEDESARTAPLMLDGLARFAADYGVTVLDGGTDSGVMKLIGDARRAGGLRFPLVGVAPLGAVRLPGTRAASRVPLNSGHSHFVLVDAARFGAESELIVRLAAALAGSQPVAGLVVNGGEVTRQETYTRAVEADGALPLLVIEGSGRFGDELARAAQGGVAEDSRIPAILARADVRLAPAEAGPERFYAELERLLAPRP